MAVVTIKAFGGISPKTPPRLLRDTQSQTANNCGVFTGSLKPTKGYGGTVATVPATSETIYKFGQDVTDESLGWLSWTTDVDVARGQINGDTEEWTFYTGDGAPKAIRAGYTTSPIPLGIAAPTTSVTPTLGTEPADAETLVAETRLYVYTFVYKIGGREIESAPSPASALVDVYPGQTVTLTSFDLPSSANFYRIYRSTSGTFLYVGEIDVATGYASGYVDNVDPELLAEEIPSLLWAEPPDDLAGLINLPNGVMAGFTGRDVYFCEPYVPHAWPEPYRQSFDYPVVGLGRMDTTLAVLTKGTPYLVQGSHPDSMVVIKSDLEQACVSKKSIVSLNNAVFYCSPDGLVALTPGGSSLVTQNLFTYDQWQETVDPTSVEAYHQDMKYIAFYDNGTTKGNFVFDLATNEFTISTASTNPTAAYQSLRNDKLYVCLNGSIRPWGEGVNYSYTWRSKIFMMPRPLSMACAQVEAEEYPLQARIYADGTLLHNQTVTSRLPFRLPVIKARDWEIELLGTKEVFSAAMAQSMEELANA